MKPKKLLFPLAAAFLGSLTIYSCMIGIGIGGNTSTTTETTVSALSQHLISPAQAKILKDEYSTKNYQLVNVGKSQPETKEVYYDIEVLEDYIKYVKAEAKKKGVKDVGIVIAFGQYPKSGNFDARLKTEYKGQQTVYLKAATNSSNTGNKVGIGGFETEKKGPDLEAVSVLDFGRLSPPN
jgi:hypothetical protein